MPLEDTRFPIEGYTFFCLVAMLVHDLYKADLKWRTRITTNFLGLKKQPTTLSEPNSRIGTGWTGNTREHHQQVGSLSRSFLLLTPRFPLLFFASWEDHHFSGKSTGFFANEREATVTL